MYVPQCISLTLISFTLFSILHLLLHRLTIVTESDDDENSCEEIIECISPDATAPPRSPDEDEGVVVPAPDEILTVVDLSNFGSQDDKHVENVRREREREREQ